MNPPPPRLPACGYVTASANATASPEDAVALTAKSGSPYVLFASAPNVTPFGYGRAAEPTSGPSIGRFEIIRVLGARPIVIGHSFGGLIAQNLLGRGLAAEAIAIDAAPIKGVLPLPLSTLRSAFPVLRNPANTHRAVPLTAEEFRYGFANAVSREEAAELYERWAIPGPGRPMFQAAFANFAPHSAAKVDTDNGARGPLLLIAGEKDHVVPPVVTRATLKQYRNSGAVTELRELAGRGHSLTIDHGWREVADTALAWLARHPVESARA